MPLDTNQQKERTKDSIFAFFSTSIEHKAVNYQSTPFLVLQILSITSINTDHLLSFAFSPYLGGSTNLSLI